MLRNTLRTGSILALLLAAIFLPFLSSGYFEIKQAESASSYPEMANHYLIAANRLPWRPDLYELTGTAYYHAKDYSSAETWYRKAFERHALSPEGWVAWGDVVYLNNEPERAYQIWQDGLEQLDPSPQLYSRLAKVYQEQRDYPTATEYLQKFVGAQPEDASAHYRLGLLLTLSDPGTAISELLRASQLDPQFDPVAQTLRTALNLASLSVSSSEGAVIIGRGLGLIEEWQLALASFESAVKADERNAEAWAWLGEAKQQTGGNDALTDLDRALSLNPNSSTVHSLRGLYFQRVGNHRDALAELKAAARLDPENPALFVSLGDAYAMTGDLNLGLQSYQYATSLVPDDPHYWVLLAAFCARNNAYVSEVGIPAAEKAILLSKNDPAALDVLGWNYLQAGRYMEAESMLKLSLEYDPQSASAHLHAAILYLQIDDRVSAYDHLIKARDLGSPEAEVALRQYFP